MRGAGSLAGISKKDGCLDDVFSREGASRMKCRTSEVRLQIVFINIFYLYPVTTNLRIDTLI